MIKKWQQSGGCMIIAIKVDEKLAPKWRMHDKCTKVDEKMTPKWRMHDKCTKVDGKMAPKWRMH